MNNLPTGSEHDPRAPWIKEDYHLLCENCYAEAPEEVDNEDTQYTCDMCGEYVRPLKHIE